MKINFNINDYKKLFIFIILFYSSISYAEDECVQLNKQIEISAQKKQYQEQLEAIKKARIAYCLGDDSFKNAAQMSNVILTQWATNIISKVVINGKKATFNKSQLARLNNFKSDIETMQKYINIKEQDWLPSLLALLLEDKFEKSKYELEMILNGYLDDKKNNKLSPIIEQINLENFISEFINAINLKDEIEVAIGKNNAQMRLIKERVIKNRDVVVSYNAPIRFHFDSVDLNQRGEQEYENILYLLQDENVKSIFMIGHSSPSGSNQYNCDLSRRRVQAIRKKLIEENNIPASKISIAWAGENIALDFGQANEFLKTRDIIVDQSNSENDDPMRRRVEIEINGNELQQRYKNLLCAESNKQ